MIQTFVRNVLKLCNQIWTKIVHSDSRYDFSLYQKRLKRRRDRRLKIEAFFRRILNLGNHIGNHIGNLLDHIGWKITYSESIFHFFFYLIIYLPIYFLFPFFFTLFVLLPILSGVSMIIEFLRKILDKILERVIGAGLFCGFMTIPTLGVNSYLFVAPSFLIDDDRSRVAAMAGFVTGQFVMFASVYNRPLYEGLAQPHPIILLFVSFFFLQLLWTMCNWRSNDLITKIKRLVLLQLQFILAFFSQWKFPYVEPDSMIHGLVNVYLKDEAKKLLFLGTSFLGWVIGHVIFMIFFVKFFAFLGNWAYDCYINRNLDW